MSPLVILLGLVSGIICIILAKKLYPNKDHAAWRSGLVIAALVYVGFSIFADFKNIGIELLGVLIYGVFAFLSKKHSLIWLSLGWLLHVL